MQPCIRSLSSFTLGAAPYAALRGSPRLSAALRGSPSDNRAFFEFSLIRGLPRIRQPLPPNSVGNGCRPPANRPCLRLRPPQNHPMTCKRIISRCCCLAPNSQHWLAAHVGSRRSFICGHHTCGCRSIYLATAQYRHCSAEKNRPG